MNFALPWRSRALLQGRERLRDLPCVAGQDVDVVGLENAAEVGLVRRAGAQPLDGRFLVAEGFKEGIGKFAASKGCSASSEMASSISTAFILALAPKRRRRRRKMAAQRSRGRWTIHRR